MSARQLEILRYVKQNAPITGEQIAEWLGLSRPTIRSDLALLVMLGYLDAKPKVGYFLGKAADEQRRDSSRLAGLKVRDVQALPVIIRENATVQDAVVTLFLENVGSLIVIGQDGQLAGMVSRKDLLKVTLGNASAPQMPVSLVMTRQPNIATVQPDDSVVDAARKMIQHEVDTLPVLEADAEQPESGRHSVVGRITKTTLTKVLVSLAGGPDGL
ncbi:transcriptional regulator [Paenibacillus sp. J31TS4]|nr:transcriptional regulator [Paenibacillus sp. J31TS4]